MLFQVDGLAEDTGMILAALRVHDAGTRIECDLAAGRIDVMGQVTSAQVIAALRSAGYAASRAPAPQQIHVSGGSDCCGSCS
jgi:hypothetical protein